MKKIAYVFVLVAIIFASCEKEDGTVDEVVEEITEDTIPQKSVYEMVLGKWKGTTSEVYVVIPSTGEDTTINKTITNENVEYKEDGVMIFNGSQMKWKLAGDSAILVTAGSWVDFPYYIMEINDTLLTTQSRQVFQQQGKEMHEIITKDYIRK